MTDEAGNIAGKTVKAALILFALLLSVVAQTQTITGKVVDVSDSNRADYRQPQQQDIPLAELPGLQQGVREEPRTVQDGGQSAGCRG
jgi:hypothetical protein